MQEVQKIVRERLKAGMPVVNHPDANVLTAFAERSLPDRERTAVLDHLARCADCRDVLALSLPASEATQTVIVPARGGWLSWPVLRWGFVAAAGIAVVSLGVLQYQWHLQPVTMVARQNAPAEAVAAKAQSEPAASPPAAARTGKQQESLPSAPSSADTISNYKEAPESGEEKLIARAETPQPPVQQGQNLGGPVSGGVRGQILHGPMMPNQWQQQNARVQANSPFPTSPAANQQAANPAAIGNVPPSSRNENVEVSSQPPVGVEAQNHQAQFGRDQKQFAFAPAVGKAKAPVNVEAATVVAPQTSDATLQQPVSAAASPAVNGRNVVQLSALAPMTVPRWSITSAGALARSFDQGQTWQTVDVTANLAPANGFTSANYQNLEVVSKTARAKDGNADKKALKTTPSAVIFHAVTAIGAEVWAGGSNGALYHSLDAGGHWTPLLVSYGNTILSGDIIALQFSDAQHGQVTTSTAEIWTTSDGGQTWQKQ